MPSRREAGSPGCVPTWVAAAVFVTVPGSRQLRKQGPADSNPLTKNHVQFLTRYKNLHEAEAGHGAPPDVVALVEVIPSLACPWGRGSYLLPLGEPVNVRSGALLKVTFPCSCAPFGPQLLPNPLAGSVQTSSPTGSRKSGSGPANP